MKFILHNKYTYILVSLVAALSISACVFTPQEPETPFETIETKDLITLDGEVYPFSVSISTRATHRLANIDGKLIAYLYSDIVDLSQFESHIVELDGFWKNEKMQEIFYVEAIRLQDLDESLEDEDPIPQRFTTKNFTFQYPPTWEYSRSPIGVAHFTDKQDTQRRVFLQFSAEKPTKQDLQKEPNVSISGMNGIQTITFDTAEKENQEINLFSNYFDKKYTFIFSGTPEQKKDFLLLINSFVEGAQEVAQVLEEEKRLLAEREASKLKQKKEALALKELEDMLDTNNTEEDDQTQQDIEDSEDAMENENQNDNETKNMNTESESESENNTDTAPLLGTDIPVDKNFENLIDERAFAYTSDYYNLALKVPFGYWFRNFGPQDEKLFRIGFAPHEINSEADPTFWLEGITTDNAPQVFTQKNDNKNIILTFPRTKTSYFQFTGPVEYRDAMMSILLSIE